jgi:hypothetical protein
MLSWDEVTQTLKPFQIATTDAAFEGLWCDGTKSRFLVADEVGLGKTLVAKGIIARTIEKVRALGDERVDVVYICSNHAIARQNLRKLAGVVGRGKEDAETLTHADRLTMLVAAEGLAKKGVNIVGLTPGTSFTFGHRSGKFEERALLYAVLRQIWPGGRDLLDSPRGARLFYYGIGEDDLEHARRRLKEESAKHAKQITSHARQVVKELVDQRNQTLRNEQKPDLYRRIGQLAPEYRRRVAPADRVMEERLGLLGDLRQILAEAGVNLLQPDLVIMDEFQRFAELLDPDSDGKPAQLLRTLLGATHRANRASTKVLLLSATPYRWFDPSGKDLHHTDFYTTLCFLHGGDKCRAQPAVAALKELRQAVEIMDAACAERAARTASVELRKVMCRTERLSSTADRNGMLKQELVPAGLTEADVRAFVAAQKLSDLLKAPSVVELWKTSPWVPNLGDGYTITDKLESRCEGQLFDWADESLLDIQRIAAFEEIDIPNPRLRWLKANTVDRGWQRLLWVPASAPYYSVDNDFARLAADGMTKHLVFSSWRIAPKAIALGVTYAAEEEVRSALRVKASADAGHSPVVEVEGDGMDEWGTSAYRSSRRAQLELSEAGGRLRLTSFLLFAPLVGLAELVDPLSLGCRGARSLEEVRREIGRLVRKGLQVKARDGASRTTAVDWYVAAARGFDRPHGWWNTAKPAHFASEDEGEAGLRACVDAFRNPERPAGAAPSDLEDVLVDLALGSPAVCALRGLSRVFGVPCSDPAIVSAAARVAWAFRSYLSRPETINVIDAFEFRATTAHDYWRRVLRYTGEGNLQAVFDEYFHMLREWKLGGQRDTAMAAELAEVAADALSFRAVTLDVRVPRPGGGQEKRKLRSRFAVRFGDRAGDDDTDRKDVTATAFNSPFWPFVMATTSIGQEGLDFHLYSHAVVHWNLPADPVALEQREGRVHRFKGHAVRKNVAAVSEAVSCEPTTDIWDVMFDEATPNEDFDGIVPFWVFEGGGRLENPAKVKRVVPVLPMSCEVDELDRLRQAAVTYRIAFGQPRHDDLLEAVEGRTDLPTIDLSPRAAEPTS